MAEVGERSYNLGSNLAVPEVFPKRSVGTSLAWSVFSVTVVNNVPQISDRELSQKKTITLHRNGKDNTKKVHP